MTKWRHVHTYFSPTHPLSRGFLPLPSIIPASPKLPLLKILLCAQDEHAACEGELCCFSVGRRSARDQLMNTRGVMSHDPTGGVTSRPAPMSGERRSVSVVERTSRGQMSGARAQPLLA